MGRDLVQLAAWAGAAFGDSAHVWLARGAGGPRAACVRAGFDCARVDRDNRYAISCDIFFRHADLLLFMRPADSVACGGAWIIDRGGPRLQASCSAGAV